MPIAVIAGVIATGSAGSFAGGMKGVGFSAGKDSIFQ